MMGPGMFSKNVLRVGSNSGLSGGLHSGSTGRSRSWLNGESNDELRGVSKDVLKVELRGESIGESNGRVGAVKKRK